MNKAFEKILERLEENKLIIPVNGVLDDIIKDKPKELGQLIAYNNSIKIVQEVADEYHGGWIPCSERLPEIGQEVIVATKNGSVYSNIYYDYIDSNAKEPCFHRWDDEMWNCFMLDVIAWQPLPKPFKERD